MRSELRALYREHVATLAKGFARALAAEGWDSLVIESGKLVSKSRYDDQYWSMSPVPMFSYWVPVKWPECAIHLAAGRAPRLIVYRENSYWERPSEPDWSLIGEALEIVEVGSEEEMKQAIGAGQRTAVWAQDGAPPEGLADRLEELRVFKTAYEVECQAEASRIGARGHRAAADAFAAGERSELALHLCYLEATNQDDVDTPYKNIVALGDAAAILHHVTYRKAPEAKSFLLDAGASYYGYHSDITRTHVSGRGLFSELLQRMELMQQRIVSKVAVGLPFESLHDESHRELAEVLVELGIVTSSAEAAVETGVTRKLYPHGLGHSLGIQVHDVGCRKKEPRPDNPFLRNTRVIEPGMVFTIEPGCYFIDTLLAELKSGPQASTLDWKKIDELRPYGGIRIEDNVNVLPKGSRTNVRNLTREAFAT
jgi:Xaa-Pro dipeptidase